MNEMNKAKNTAVTFLL